MRLVGLEVAGWSDVAARDWDYDDVDSVIGPVRVLDGGIGGVAVRDRGERWIGGPQALLAPHGLGRGWGELGGGDRRIAISDCHEALMQGQPAVVSAYAAALRSLSRQAERAYLTVADIPQADEAVRERFIDASRAAVRRTTLLWRPVALFLDALANGLIRTDEVGRSFAFLIHCGHGFELQTLRLRQDSEHPGHYAPERDGYGERLDGAFGLRPLAEHVHQEVLRANPPLMGETFGKIAMAPGLLAGRIAPGARHVVRHDNGNWIEVKAPDAVSIAPSDALAESVMQALDRRGPVASMFVATPLAPAIADELLRPLRRRCELRLAPWSSLAIGALGAGRLIERGLTHYFDRLTPISLAVFKGDEPVFFDLIGRNATLPANKEFVSRPYRELEWPAGKREIEFCILKGDDEIRKWKVTVTEAPARTMPVELRLRQTPGQSWAKLELSSQVWDELQRSPVFLDWSALKPLDEKPEQVLQRLRRPPPTIPSRIVEEAAIELWRGDKEARVAGLLPLLAGERYDASDVARFLSRPIRLYDGGAKALERRCSFSTDGDLPVDLAKEALARFNAEVAKLCDAVLGAARSGKPLRGNHELRALTWMFTRCPDAVQEVIVEALEADQRARPHALLMPTAARTVLMQGAGRCVSGAARIRRVLTTLTAVEPHVAGRKANNNTFNGLAMILSRRKEAPEALDPALVKKIARILLEELKASAASGDARAFKTRFKNALSALAGLFRYREVEPYALLLNGEDLVATNLWEDLKKIETSLVRARQSVFQAESKIELVGELVKLLEGRGDPNILRRIEASEDDDGITEA